MVHDLHRLHWLWGKMSTCNATNYDHHDYHRHHHNHQDHDPYDNWSAVCCRYGREVFLWRQFYADWQPSDWQITVHLACVGNPIDMPVLSEVRRWRCRPERDDIQCQCLCSVDLSRSRKKSEHTLLVLVDHCGWARRIWQISHFGRQYHPLLHGFRRPRWLQRPMPCQLRSGNYDHRVTASQAGGRAFCGHTL